MTFLRALPCQAAISTKITADVWKYTAEQVITEEAAIEKGIEKILVENPCGDRGKHKT